MNLNPFAWLNWDTSPTIRDEAPLREAAGVSIDPDEALWRRLTGDGNRDLSPMTQRRMQNLATYQWQSNPGANRLIELPGAYLLADGVKLVSSAEDPDLRAIVQDWI